MELNEDATIWSYLPRNTGITLLPFLPFQETKTRQWIGNSVIFWLKGFVIFSLGDYYHLVNQWSDKTVTKSSGEDIEGFITSSWSEWEEKLVTEEVRIHLSFTSPVIFSQRSNGDIVQGCTDSTALKLCVNKRLWGEGDSIIRGEFMWNWNCKYPSIINTFLPVIPFLPNQNHQPNHLFFLQRKQTPRKRGSKGGRTRFVIIFYLSLLCATPRHAQTLGEWTTGQGDGCTSCAALPSSSSTSFFFFFFLSSAASSSGAGLFSQKTSSPAMHLIDGQSEGPPAATIANSPPGHTFDGFTLLQTCFLSSSRPLETLLLETSEQIIEKIIIFLATIFHYQVSFWCCCSVPLLRGELIPSSGYKRFGGWLRMPSCERTDNPLGSTSS